MRLFDPAAVDPATGGCGTWTRWWPLLGSTTSGEFPPVEVEIPDITSGPAVQRRVPLLFTTVHGIPFTDRTWLAEWVKWRRAAEWPEEHGGFHALRHFFATALITNHADPKDVQRVLRHSTLSITLGRSLWRLTCTSGHAEKGGDE